MTNEEKVEEIINKKFKKAVFSGYDSVDVDAFFDQVIEYLQNNDKIVKSYKDDMEKMKNEMKKMNSTIESLEKDKAKLKEKVKEYQDEGYDNIFLKRRK
ncbi:MAG: DivIVA domain-containing protein [Mycoplasmoidaceae bacterium]